MNIIIGSNGYLGSFLSYKYTSINVISDNDTCKNGLKYSDFIRNYNNNFYNNYNIFICSSYNKTYDIINNLKEKSKNKTFG